MLRAEDISPPVFGIMAQSKRVSPASEQPCRNPDGNTIPGESTLHHRAPSGRC
jgi:hypothetical protein